MSNNKREIKFRGWKEEEKDWAYLILGAGLLNKHALEWGLEGKGTGIRLYIKEWQQFTGLKDKNGKEIWEGDIVKSRYYWSTSHDGYEPGYYKTEHTEVRWDNDNGRWESIFDLAEHIKYYKVEVIGNIYENPELLK